MSLKSNIKVKSEPCALTDAEFDVAKEIEEKDDQMNTLKLDILMGIGSQSAQFSEDHPFHFLSPQTDFE